MTASASRHVPGLARLPQAARHVRELRQRVRPDQGVRHQPAAGEGLAVRTRPTLNTYNAKRDALLKSANDLFSVVGSGTVKIPVNQKYPLKDAQKAHRDLEGRKTTGSTVLMP